MGELLRFGWMNARFVTTKTESLHDRDAVIARALSLVQGQRVDDVARMCDRIVPGIVRTRTNLAVVSEIRRHRALGDQTWLVTASPVELAEAIARQLGMTGALGTRAQSRDGVYTGDLVGDVLHGSRKAEAISALAAVEGHDLMECSAYSDSVNDLPMLVMVGRSSVVNPNKQLRHIASRNGWRVIDGRAAGSAPELAGGAASISPSSGLPVESAPRR